jgi:hypothetical protein
MLLVEALRLRTWSLWWAAIIAALGILLVATVSHSSVDVNGSRLNGVPLSLVMMTPLAMFLAMIYATSAGLSLCREAQTLALSWTKPVARPLIALRLIAVDVVAVIAAYIFAWIVILGVIAGCGGTVTGGADAPAIIALSLGVVLMWYALIQAVTSALPVNSGVVVGFLWPGAIILAGLHFHINATIDTVIDVLNVFNPIAYLTNASSSASSNATIGSFWQAPPDERALIVYALTCVLTAIAIALWTRREA